MTNNKQQTAVEWFIQKLEEEELIFNHGLVEGWKQQAKEMEKEQMIDAITQFGINRYNIWSESGILDLVNRAEKYYNETYGGGE